MVHKTLPYAQLLFKIQKRVLPCKLFMLSIWTEREERRLPGGAALIISDVLLIASFQVFLLGSKISLKSKT